MLNTRLAVILIVVALAARSAAGDEPSLAIPRILPPPGIKLAEADEQELTKKLDSLQQRIEALDERLRKIPRLGDGTLFDDLIPDVLIYTDAVEMALKHGEFFAPGDVKTARDLLDRGEKRLAELEGEKRPVSWQTQRGPVVRGYRSEIDGSVQPFGLVIPEGLKLNDSPTDIPLYVWLHGRGDKQTNLQFIAQRQSKPGEFLPSNGIVVHPFGRYCNAFKFAGETDVFEAIIETQVKYPITGRSGQDTAPVVLAGFSMGGAGAWHLGAHYPGTWRAVSPGAGFAETALYQKLSPDKYPAGYEQRLWGLYDAPNYVRNLFNGPVIAYSGELDKQIQAARVMEAAYSQEGQQLEHRIGPGMEHKYEPKVLAQLTRDLAKLAETPPEISARRYTFQTRTLRYPGPLHLPVGRQCFTFTSLRRRVNQFQLTGLDEQWGDSRFDILFKTDKVRRIDRECLAPSGIEQITTKNVRSFVAQLAVPEGETAKLKIDGDTVSVTMPISVFDSVKPHSFAKVNGHWQVQTQATATPATPPPLSKRPFLQGPIDDAFYEPFLVVTPSGKSNHPQIEKWVQAELAHFDDRWQRLFRGKLRIKADRDVTAADHERYHLVAWGDATSNSVIREALKSLPVQWTEQEVVLNGQRHSSTEHVPVLIYPNPHQSAKGFRYLVINSGPTYREQDDKSNSLQTPKLPDWAVIDVRVPPDGKRPGGIVDAGFFDEAWSFVPRKGS